MTRHKASDQQLVIVADDLTGAADAAAAFAARTSTAVVLNAGAPLPDCAVVSVDTDTRHVPSSSAADTVDEVVRASIGAGARVYNKIDSTLRGNVAVEIRATLAAVAAASSSTAAPIAVLAPAFPGTGRTVSGGVVHVDGQALDSRHAGGDLRRLLSERGLSGALIGLDRVRAGAEAVSAAIMHARETSVDAVCVDADTEADLHVVAAAIEHLDAAVVPTGSAGLARVMAELWSLPEQQQPAREQRAGHALLVLGSYSEVARRQRQGLSPEVTVVAVAEPYDRYARERATEWLRQGLYDGDAVLIPDPDAPVQRERAAEVAAALAQVGGAVLSEAHRHLAGVILTGGETARAVLLAAGVTDLDIAGELEPGVVLGSLPDLEQLPLVTKAGRFGDAGTLERARRGLHPFSFVPRSRSWRPVS